MPIKIIQYLLSFIIFISSTPIFAQIITDEDTKNRIIQSSIRISPSKNFEFKEAPSDTAKIIQPLSDKSEEYYTNERISEIYPEFKVQKIPHDWRIIVRNTPQDLIIGWAKESTFTTSHSQNHRQKLSNYGISESDKRALEQIKTQIPNKLRGKYCFQDIYFGTSFDVIDRILKIRYHASDITQSDHLLSLGNFKLGNQMATVSLYFDHNNKFYAYDLSTVALSADKLNTEVYQDSKFLTETFTYKFGRPAKCLNPTILNIKYGYISYVCNWNNKDMIIYTGLGVSEFTYYAIGHVASKSMKREHDKFMQKQQKINATKGAADF